MGEAVPLKVNRAAVIELPPNLDIATEKFRDFLRRTGFPEQVRWVTCHDLILRPEAKAFIRARDWDTTLGHARAVYAEAVRNGYAIAIEAWAATDTSTYAEVWAIKDDAEAEYLMMRSGLVKYGVPATRVSAVEVNSLRWAYLNWRHTTKESWKTLPHCADGVLH